VTVGRATSHDGNATINNTGTNKKNQVEAIAKGNHQVGTLLGHELVQPGNSGLHKGLAFLSE